MEAGAAKLAGIQRAKVPPTESGHCCSRIQQRAYRVENLEVKVFGGWEPGRIRTEGRTNWQAVAHERAVEGPKSTPHAKRIVVILGVLSR
jgi:hypothetical protein